jgi:hypothetical protein
MRRESLIAILVVILVSLFFLSVLSNILTGYPERPPPPDPEKEPPEKDTEEEPSVLLFKVSPVTPQLYWRVSTADYYTGSNWLRTTEEKVLEEFPQVQDANATKVFTVELNTSQHETFLPLPPPNSTFANLSSAQIEGLEFYEDTVGNVYKVIKHGQKEASLAYEVLWRDVEIDDGLISLSDVPEEILDKYLQLPDVLIGVDELARDLEDPSYSILDQVLADVQYLRTNFVYDDARSRFVYEGIRHGSDVSSYIRRGKGICIDAATALVVILRYQEIPARISIGYKPGRIEDGRVLYYTTGAHAVTEVYLPPYGWIQFDATPPPEEIPLVKVSPFKKEACPGSRLFYQLSITNRCNSTDNFELFTDGKKKWNIEAAPEELEIEAHQTAYGLLEVTVPDDAFLGEKCVATVTVASLSRQQITFSIVAIIQVENIHYIPTTTTFIDNDKVAIRGDTFWLNGTVLTASDEQIDNMTVLIFLTKSRKAEGVIVGEGSSKKGSFQIEGTIPHFMEIGDYKVVSISLGTAQYAPSSSEFILRVRATTRMELGHEEEFMLGYGAIHGGLFWDNGTGFANAPISLKITSSDTPSKVTKLQNLTSEDGSFRIATTFENPGVYEVEAMFSGNGYVFGSNATRVVELKCGVPVIQIFGENTATRGETFNITGVIRFEDTGVWGEPVTVAFDNQLLMTIETRINGSYAWSFPVSPEEKLGLHILTMALEKSNVSAVHKVVVKSETTLTTKVSDVAGGMFISFSASLFDDHDMPIQGAEIVVDDYGCSWKTGKDGNVTFLLDTVNFWPENLVLTAKFEGSELYLPVAFEKEVALEPETSLPFLIPLVSPTLAVIVFMYSKHYSGRQQPVQQTDDMNVAEERTIVEEEPAYRPQEMQPLKILLPDIEGPLPNVWGANDKLRIEIVLDKSVFERKKKRGVEVLIDQEPVAPVRLSRQGRVELSHMFIKKGEHKVKAILLRTSGQAPLSAEIKLCIVDYEEEIIRLYNKFLEKLSSQGIKVRNEMTAQEIESLILRTSDFCSETLRIVTACFEKAEYSNHLATREDYKIMYLSLRELNNDI